MTASADQRGSQPDASIRMDARLDAMTRAKVDDLAARFHQTRAAVLRHIMHWGLHHGQALPREQEGSTDDHPKL
jgi:hypothetical protein